MFCFCLLLVLLIFLSNVLLLLLKMFPCLFINFCYEDSEENILCMHKLVMKHSMMKGYDCMTFEPWSAFMIRMHQCTQQ